MNGPNNSGMGGPSTTAAAAAASRQGNSPSQTQLKLLVQQIQMAVQAGHLNQQILNQPLAPQTLVLLNQLLQQIKTLQNYQHTLQSQKSLGGGGVGASNMNILSVDITKTKQDSKLTEPNFSSASQLPKDSTLATSHARGWSRWYGLQSRKRQQWWHH